MMDLEDVKQKFMTRWGVDGMPADKKRLANAAWDECANHCEKIIEELRRDCAEVYQVVGSAMTEPYPHYTYSDVERVLDNLSAAANGDQRPHDDLLPWPMDCKARIRAAKIKNRRQ